MTNPTTKPKGFAAIPAERQREIAAMGGRAAHQQGTAHEFTTEEAREAARKARSVTHGVGLEGVA